MSIWKRATFWVKLKDSFALGGLLGQAGMEVIATNEMVKIWVAIGTILGYLIGMWMSDENKDGVVDLFEKTDK